MAILQLPSPDDGPTVRERPQLLVSVKPRWGDEWKPYPYLQALACSDAAGPNVPWAAFRWAAGEVKWEDETDFSTRVPIDLKDQFVKIEVLAADDGATGAAGGGAEEDGGVTGPPLFIGRICDEAMDAKGTDHGPLGDQDLAAFGLAHELDRCVIDGSLVQVASDSSDEAVKVDAALTFNGGERRGPGEVGNRSNTNVQYTRTDAAEEDQGRAFYVFFGGEEDNRETWTVKDVLEYLLGGFGPAKIKFRLGGQLDAIESLDAPPTAAMGRTVFEILNTLLDRRRGLGWRVVVAAAEAADTPEKVEINVYTLVEEELKFGKATLPAAAEQTELVVEDYRRLIAEHRLSIDTLTRYGRITVAGALVLACFTVSTQDETLSIGWTGAEENLYKQGAGESGDDTQSKKKNDVARAAESLAHVFTRYLISPNWNWRAGDGEGGEKKNANGKVDDTAGFEPNASGGPPPIRKWGRRLERWIPIRKPTGAEGSEPEYQEPLVLVKDDVHTETGASSPTGTDRWMPAERTLPGLPKAHVRMLDRDFGIEVRFSPAHLIARARMDGAKPTDKPAVFTDQFLIATVAARTDERLAATIEVEGAEDVDRTLLIDVPGAELWYIVPGTVTDVDKDGKLVREEREGSKLLLRNDGPKLWDVALLAQAWYGKQRASLRITFKELMREFRVGLFVRQVSDAWRFDPVNSSVSRVSYDLVAMTTTIETQFAELDFAAAFTGGGS